MVFLQASESEAESKQMMFKMMEVGHVIVHLI